MITRRSPHLLSFLFSLPWHAAAETLTTSCHAYNGYGDGDFDSPATVSVLSANPTATTYYSTYSGACEDSTETTCLFTKTQVDGPSTFAYRQAIGSTYLDGQELTWSGSGEVQYTYSIVSGTSTASRTTTYSSSEDAFISVVPLVVTAGQEKLAAATGATPIASATDLITSTNTPPAATDSVLTTTWHDINGIFGGRGNDGDTVSVLSANPTATTYISTYNGLCDNTLTRETTCIMTATHVDGPSTFAETISVDSNLAYTYDYKITGDGGGIGSYVATSSGLTTSTSETFKKEEVGSATVYVSAGQEKLAAATGGAAKPSSSK